MKFNSSVLRWAVASAFMLVGYQLVANTTLLFSYSTSDGASLSPRAASDWCNSVASTLGYTPAGCGEQKGLLAFAVLLGGLFIAFALVALVKARKAAKQ